jgi:uncharacterized membrane protein YphA (DoxX/SURF4 family)
MELIVKYHEAVAVFIVRVFLGVLFFFQGYDAVFNIKIKNVINTYQYSFEKRGVPGFIVVLGVWFTSIVELVGGFSLILGFMEYPSLCALGFDLLIASFAFSINVPMWDMKHVFPRLVLLIFLLVTPVLWHIYSLDNLFFNH